MVLGRNTGEEFEVSAVVGMLVQVFHSDLREHAGHHVGAELAFETRHCPVSTGGCPFVGRCATETGTEHAGTRKLFDANGETHIAFARLDRHDHGTKRGCTSCTRIRNVEHRDAGLANLLLQLLANTCRSTHEVSSGEDAHVMNGHTAISESSQRSFCCEINDVFVRMLSELGHVDAENPNVIVCHGHSPQLTGSKP